VVAVTQASQVLVVQVVQPAVGGLLADKTLDLGPPVGLLILGQVGQANAQGIHEKLLAHRKTHRQGIEQSAQKRVVTVPMSIHGGLHVDQQLSDGQVVHVCQWGDAGVILPLPRASAPTGVALFWRHRHKNRYLRTYVLAIGGDPHRPCWLAIVFIKPSIH
jgi:hypothetical protein